MIPVELLVGKFVLNCANDSHILHFPHTQHITESVSYVFSICTIVGAPRLDSEMWNNSNHHTPGSTRQRVRSQYSA
jgi:hypothetical protein